MARTSSRTSALAARLLCSTAILLLPGVALANPAGGQVKAGSATIAQPNTASTTVTQQSEKAIIDWQSFSIGRGEAATFQQPDAKAITLNRVTGVDPSKIAGSLTANGQVWLINPNGIAFSKSARVDVAGLLATTIDISNKDFMAGNYHFRSASDPGAMVTNAGHITIHDTGLAALVAPGVANSGVIEANLGQIQLSSAAAFTVDLYGDGLFNITLDKQVTKVIKKADGTTAKTAVSNSGTMIADGGKILMTADAAKSVVDHAIDMTGYAQATSASVSQNGDIVLDGGSEGTVAVAGTLNVSGKDKGQTGGTVEVTGQDVQLASTAKVDASGDSGGGTVHIGGDKHGAGPLRNASTTSVASGATINANAVTSGNGGNVVVWSNDKTDYQGSISAKGGSSRGDGGSAEVSSHGLLNFSGTVDLRAPNGRTGSLLLDPENVTISTNGEQPTLPSSPSGAVDLTANADNSVLAVSTLQSALALADVTVSTGTTGSQAGDITVASDVTWSSGNSLTLSAYRNITVNDGVTIASTGSGNLNLNADNTGTGIGIVTFNGTGKVDFSGSTGLVSIFYNPTDNPAGSVVNATSYTSPTDYSPYVLTNSSVTGQLTAYMLVNTDYDLQNIENNLSGDYALGHDIDASGTISWNSGTGFMPIGGIFTGMLDGQSHTISNITINATLVDVGLFVNVAQPATVRSLGITNPAFYGSYTGGSNYTHAVLAGHNEGTVESITLDSSPAALVGENSGTISSAIVTGLNLTAATPVGSSAEDGGVVGTNLSGGTIENSSVTGTITTTGNSYTYVGGLVGYNYGTISNSWASIAATNNSGADYLGGLVGYNGTGATIESSHAGGSVYGTCACGGLVGYNAGTIKKSYADNTVGGDNGVDIGGLASWNAGTITQSYATGAVTAGANGNNRAGGLVAVNPSGGSISQSYATGAVSGKAYAVGGLAGEGEGSVTQSYATGHLSSTASSPSIGGLIGYAVSTPTVTYSYWDKQTTGTSTSVAGTARTTAELTSGLPTGFDSTVWTTDSSKNSGYPILQWQNASSGGSTTSSPVTVYFGAYSTLSTTSLTWNVSDTSSTYGTLATLGDASFEAGTTSVNLDPGNYSVGLFLNSNGTDPVTLSAGLNVGTYYEGVTSLTGTAASSYTLGSGSDGILAIAPATLTYVAKLASRTYGDPNPTFTGSVTGFVLGQDLSDVTTGTLTFTSDAKSTSNVGTYAIIGAGLTANNGNYVFAQAAGNASALMITPRPITITADDETWTVGADNNTPLTWSVTTGSLVGNDEPTGALSTTATRRSLPLFVGYPITQGTLMLSKNYALTFVPGTLQMSFSQQQQQAANQTASQTMRQDTYNFVTRTGTGTAVTRTYSAADATTDGYTFVPLSQQDANAYLPGSTALADWGQTCIAIVYTMIARALGDKVGGKPPTASHFWSPDACKGKACAVPRELAKMINPPIGQNPTPFNGATVGKELKAHKPVIIRGTITHPREKHSMLATGLDANGNIIANDPWTGEQVTISWKTGRILAPVNAKKLGFKAVTYRTVSPTALGN